MLATEVRTRVRPAEIWSLGAAVASCCCACGCSPCGCRPGTVPVLFGVITGELVREGYLPYLHPIDRDAARATRCHRCCGPMGYRGFRLVEEELVLGYRAFAVCAVCGRWAEF